MTFLIAILSLLIGGGIGYGAFYFTYKDVKHIDELKANLHMRSEDIERLQRENDDLMEENDFLRLEAERLDSENRNYKDIVAKLQGNKNVIEKLTKLSKEMASLLGVYDKEVEFEVKKVIGTQIERKEPEEEMPRKKFF